MPTIIVKNLAKSLHKKIKERSRKNQNSINQEVLALIEKAVAESVEQVRKANIDYLAAIFAAGDQMALDGVDFRTWAATSRDVWGRV